MTANRNVPLRAPKTVSKHLIVTTPAPKKNRAQLWGMAFMSAGLMVCTPALAGMHEESPAAIHGKPANSNTVLRLIS